MSAPFGGHPTFAQYIGWAIKKGCTVKSGYAETKDGHMERVTVIHAADGERRVVEVGTDQRDYLVPTTIARFDRRLGVKSEWFAIDDTDNDKGS